MSNIIDFNKIKATCVNKEEEVNRDAYEVTKFVATNIINRAMATIYSLIEDIDVYPEIIALYLEDVMEQSESISTEYILDLIEGCDRKERLIRFDADISKVLYDTIDVYIKLSKEE